MPDNQDLLHGNPEYIAAFLGVNIRTIKRYKAGYPLPETCRKLLRLRFDGDVSALMGKDWQGFYFGRDGELYLPGYKYGFNPDQIKAMFFNTQEIHWYRQEFKRLQAELAKHSADLWAMRQVRNLADLQAHPFNDVMNTQPTDIYKK